MPPNDNWHEITPSSFTWEREALEHIRQHLPKSSPYAAWANFEFLDGADRLYEVDLLLCAPKGLWLVEIKSWPGLVEGDEHTLRWTNPEGRTVARDHPVRLANAKAKSLKSLLGRSPSARRKALPFLGVSVFLSDPSVEVRVNEQARASLVGRPDPEHRRPGVPDLVTSLIDVSTADHEAFRRNPRRRRVDRPTGETVANAMREARITPSNRMRTVGGFRLDALLSEGPGFQDFAAHHETLAGRRRRLRIYGAPQNSDDPKRQRLRRAARRESELLEGLSHPNFLPIEEYVEHDLGPALVLGISPDAPTLDAWLTEHGAKLSLLDKLTFFNQLVDALRYAHSHGLVHRGLSPRSIFVDEHGAPRIGDWHTGARLDTEQLGSTIAGTRNVGELAPEGASGFLAPEAPFHDELSAAADVFSLGAIGYLLLVGRPPAQRHEELLVLLRDGGGLDVSAAVDGVGQQLRELIRETTRPAVTDRFSDAGEVMVFLQDVIREAMIDDEAGDVVDALQAGPGDAVDLDLTVLSELGTGSTARALLVEDDAGAKSVLKVALDEERGSVLHDEAEVLRAVEHPAIVRLLGLRELGSRTALLLQYATEGTVARRLTQDGPFSLEYLQRLGADLLEALRQCEREGYVHRDIKPDNLGLVTVGRNDAVHLLVLDFSLSRADPTALRAGTPHYLDPFLGQHDRMRFDAAADRWAAAVTLHELATGRRPIWGDGASNPAATGDDPTFALDIVDPSVRPRLTAFFARAFVANVDERHHTAEEMLQAWQLVFAHIDEPVVRGDETPTGDPAELLRSATLSSPLATIGLSAQQVAALERHNVVTVEDLVRLPSNDLMRLRGVGNRMRRELARATGALRRLLAEDIARAGLSREPQETMTPDGEPDAPDVQGLDALSAQLVPDRAPDQQGVRLQRALLSLPLEAGGDPAPAGSWPAATEVASLLAVDLGAVRLARDAGVRRWRRLSAVTRLRDTLIEELDALGGVATADELADRVLALRGSIATSTPLRPALARAATRAAMEVELDRPEKRLVQRRIDGRVLIASTTSSSEPQLMLDRAVALGEEADRIAEQDPLLAPSEVVARLQAVDRASELVPLSPTRLLALGAASSRRAAASPRGELYPEGLSAERAVSLAQGALLGVPRLSVDDLRQRIISRYPRAAALPERPAALTELLERARVDLQYDPEQKAFYPSALPMGLTGLAPGSTSGWTVSAATTVDDAALEADEYDRMLERARRDGGPFVIVVPPSETRRAQRALVANHGLEPIDVERFVLEGLRELADTEDIEWSLLTGVDQAGDGDPRWGNLLAVFAEVHSKLVDRVLGVEGTALLHNAGILARYGGTSVFTDLRACAAQGKANGWWLLVPQDAQSKRPLLDGRPLELRGDYEWTRAPTTWLRKHREEILTA